MEDYDKTKEQLLKEVYDLRARVSQLETRAAQDRLKLAILDNAPLTVWASDRECKIVLWSKQAEKIYGYAEHEALGEDFVSLFVDQPEQEAARADCIRIIDENVMFRNFLAYDQNRNGTRLYMLTNCFRAKDDGAGKYVQVELGLEISDLVVSEERHRTLRELGKERLALKKRFFELERKSLLSRIAMALHKHLTIIDEERRVLEDYIAKVMRERKCSREMAEELSRLNLEQLDTKTKQVKTRQEDFNKQIIDAKTLSDLDDVSSEVELFERSRII